MSAGRCTRRTSCSGVRPQHTLPCSVLDQPLIRLPGDCLCSVSAKQYPNNACLGFRRIVKGLAMPYEFLTYKEVSQRVAHVAGAFKALGLKAEDRVGVLGPNCPEWMLAMQVSGMRKGR